MSSSQSDTLTKTWLADHRLPASRESLFVKPNIYLLHTNTKRTNVYQSANTAERESYFFDCRIKGVRLSSQLEDWNVLSKKRSVRTVRSLLAVRVWDLTHREWCSSLRWVSRYTRVPHHHFSSNLCLYQQYKGFLMVSDGILIILWSHVLDIPALKAREVRVHVAWQIQKVSIFDVVYFWINLDPHHNFPQ